MKTTSLLATVPCLAAIVLTARASHSPATPVLDIAGGSLDSHNTNAVGVPSSRGLTGEQQQEEQQEQQQEQQHERLAVVVPAQHSNLYDVLESLEKWPHLCYPQTLQHVDLVILFAGEDQPQPGVLEALRQGGGRCFANSRIVLGDKVIHISGLLQVL